MTDMDIDKRMEELTGKFLDGATNNDEEQALYEYYAGNGVARHLKKYEQMFRWYAGGMVEQLPQRRKAHHRLAWTGLGVAASVLLLFGAGMYCRQNIEEQRMHAMYEGSYIVRNGKKITDLNVIMPELKRIENATENRRQKYKSISRMSPKEIFRLMEDSNRGNNNEPTI